MARRSALGLALLHCASALRPTVVVTGATGRVGSEVVRALRSAHDASIVVLVRDAAKARAAFDFADELTVLEADYADEAAVGSALATLEPSFRLFLACANGPAQATLETNLLRAAERAGASFCCKLSTVGAVLAMKKGGPYAAHLQVEEALRESALRHCVLRPSLFMQMLLGSSLLGCAESLRSTGACAHPFAERRVAMIDARDVGAVAASVCASTRTDEHDGRVYDLTGSESVVLGRHLTDACAALGRQIEISPVPLEEYVASMGQLPAAAVESLLGFLGVLGSECGDVSDAVPALLGRPARSLRAFVADHAEEFVPPP